MGYYDYYSVQLMDGGKEPWFVQSEWAQISSSVEREERSSTLQYIVHKNQM